MTRHDPSNAGRPFDPARRSLPWALLLGLALGLALSPAAGAMPSLEFFHADDTDPEDAAEGWTRLGFPLPGLLDEGLADVEIGPVDPDACSGCGLTAWGVDDRSDLVGSTLRYEHTPTPQQVVDADVLGWTLRVQVRVALGQDNQPTGFDPVDASVFAEFREGALAGQRRFRILSGSEVYSAPHVWLSGTTEEYFDPLIPETHYALYELMYRPDLGSATLFVDGTERISGYAGELGTAGGEGVAWGSDSDTGLGRGHFHLVEWEIGLPTCFDGVDNDGDGLFDLADPSCMNDPNGTTEDHATLCDDGLDNDGDGAVDLADLSCLGDPTLDSEDLGTACDDHVDNDGDGDTDLADDTCDGDPRNDAEVTACDDGLDNDADGRADLADAGCLMQVTGTGEAGEIVVNTTLDKIDVQLGDATCETDVPGECSLRAALMTSTAMPGRQGIQLPAGDYEMVLLPPAVFLTGALVIRDGTVLVGDGASVTRIGPDTPSFPDSIFTASGDDAVIAAVTVRGGAYPSGAGLRTGSGSLTLVDTTVTGNAASIEHGGISVGPGLVTLIRSRVTGNTATYNGGGIGSGVSSTLDLIDSTLSDNSAGRIGGALLHGKVTIRGSTITGNTATDPHSIGGIKFGQGHHQVTNSTFSGNVASTGGGMMVADADVTLTNVTATDNTPNGICSWTLAGVPYVENSIIAGNNGVNCGFPSNPPTSLGYNLSDDLSCPFTEVGDLQNVAPLLGPLADNGGATLTHALLAGSPAIDAADDTICPGADQRGAARPEDGDDDSFAVCDMGAVEYLPEPAGALPLALGFGLVQRLGRNARRRSTRS